MPSEQETLLLAVLRQIEVARIDYKILAADLGAPNAKAAAERWRRFYKKLKGSGGANGSNNRASPTKPTGITKQTHSPKLHKQVKFKNVGEGGLGFKEEPSRSITPPPLRRMPARKARAENYKGLLDEDSEEDMDDDEGGRKEDVKIEDGAEEDNWEELEG